MAETVANDAHAVAHESADGSPLKEYRDPETFTALYWIPSAQSTTPLPLLVHLHGAGEAGH